MPRPTPSKEAIIVPFKSHERCGAALCALLFGVRVVTAMSDQQFDLVVIGSGPAGQKGAICAAKLRKRVAVIDRTLMMGGVCVHTGTIPSKSVREAIFQLTGIAVKSFYGNNYRGNGDISVQDLSFRVKALSRGRRT